MRQIERTVFHRLIVKIAFVSGTLSLLLGVFGAVNASPTATVEIYRPNGTLQCGLGEKVSITEMSMILRENGIRTYSAREGHDGQYHIAVCGQVTGEVNIFEIAEADLPRAEGIGFSLLEMF